MIYTYTLNPALDCITWTTALREGGLNRAYRQEILPGGKGVNVAMVLTALDRLCVARGFAAGVTGEALLSALTARGIRQDFQRLSQGQTRVNLKLKTGLAGAPDPVETEVNGPGAAPSEEDVERLLVRLSFVNPGDWVILSGSLPPGVNPSLYSRMVRAANARGARCVVDVAGPA
ncbi:MAG: 1-phosphofructokinase, partial [Oscillospiraceae bacterium]|nr:1-phosphofructokinase [Oscillospiraceae bacterium]